MDVWPADGCIIKNAADTFAPGGKAVKNGFERHVENAVRKARDGAVFRVVSCFSR